MTPKEKAKELAEKFWHKISGVPDNCGVDLNSEDTYVILAKQCALIGVNEIIKSWQEDGNRKLDASLIHWWGKVKEEINKI